MAKERGVLYLRGFSLNNIEKCDVYVCGIQELLTRIKLKLFAESPHSHSMIYVNRVQGQNVNYFLIFPNNLKFDTLFRCLR